MNHNSDIILSLILPAYNTAQYLEKCVRSCENQDIDKSQYEVIIVNDGSTDNTLEVAQHLSHTYPNIRIVSQENQGLSEARNSGLRIAKGEYIWFIDSDDFIASSCLKQLLDIAQEYNLDMLGVAPSIPFRSEFPSDFDAARDLSKTYMGREWILSGNSFVGAWAYLIRRSYWINNNFKFYPGICYEDVELMPKAYGKASKIASLSTFSCYSYEQRPGSIMNSAMNEKKIMDLAKIINSHRQYIDTELDSDDELINDFEKRITGLYMKGVKSIVQLGEYKLLNRWLKAIKKQPNKVPGESIPKRLYQWLLLRYPHLFFRICRLVRRNY